MKKITKLLTVLFVAALVAASFAGCQSKSSADAVTQANFVISEDSPADIAIVVGNHANSMMPNVNDALLNEDLFNTIKAFNGNSISIVCCDGSPFLYDQITIPEPEVNLTNQQKIDSANSIKAEILTMITNMEPSTEEVDTLKAVELGSRMLASSGAQSKRLYILDSWLQTTGVLNFQEISLRSAPEDVLTSLNEVYTFTDLNLSGVDVVFSGIGDVYDPQPSLSSIEKGNLQEIADGICNTAGAKSTSFSKQISTKGIDSSLYPKVSVVETTADKIDSQALMNQAVIFDDNSKIRFKPDSYEFIDDDTATNELKNIAKIMNQNSTMKILIIGSTATDGTPQACKTLSIKRAEACRDVLENEGIDTSRITTLGAGQTDTRYRVDDIDENGSLIESEAKKNRSVIILNQDLPEAKELISELS